jgi:adenylate cyclase, class 2
MKKEIEVKAKVVNQEKLREKLLSLGCMFSEPVIQEDTTFVDFDGDYTVFMPNTNFLRIRKANGTYLFTLKRPQSNELDSIERETEISDPEQFKDMLEYMGFHRAVDVVKKRVKTRYKDMEICLDEVTGLGSFIEVEKITEGDGESVQEELFLFLESLGVKREDRVMHGYDTLIYLKDNVKKL